MIPSIEQMKIGEDQDRNVFNTLKRCLRDIDQLTDEQLAVLHFESWNVAYQRSGKRIQEELAKIPE